MLYAGEVVEVGATEQLLRDPRHPYTKGLLNCAPDFDEVGVVRRGIPGTPPVAGDWPAGCRFRAALCVCGRSLLQHRNRSRNSRRTIKCVAADRKSCGERLMAALLQVRDLMVVYRSRNRRALTAAAGISLDVNEACTLALIGESGSGKSSVARAICGLTLSPAGRYGSTIAIYRHRRIQRSPPASTASRSSFRMRRLHSIRAGRSGKAWRSRDVHGLHPSSAEHRRAAISLLQRIGLPAALAERRPHQLSGGQRQRVTIARALAAEPRIVILDEAVSALDVSVRNEILALLDELKRERGLTYLFISHDMGAVAQMASEVAVLYLGKVVESGSAEAVIRRPAHPYTRALIAAVPEIRTAKQLKHIRDRGN